MFGIKMKHCKIRFIFVVILILRIRFYFIPELKSFKHTCTRHINAIEVGYMRIKQWAGNCLVNLISGVCLFNRNKLEICNVLLLF